VVKGKRGNARYGRDAILERIYGNGERGVEKRRRNIDALKASAEKTKKRKKKKPVLKRM